MEAGTNEVRLKGRSCSEDGCGEKVKSLGYCGRHYQQFRKGSLNATPSGENAPATPMLKGADLAEAILTFVRKLKVPQGGFKNRLFEVLPWEEMFVHGLASHTLCALTIGRMNGKTTFCSALAVCAVHPKGPLFIDGGQIILAASSLKQAGIAFKHVKDMMGREVDDTRTWRVTDNSHEKLIEHRATGTELKCIGSDAARAHGLAPSMVLADEPAKWKLSGREFYNSLSTALGKQTYSLFLAMGTKPDKLGHWFSELLEDTDEGTYIQSHAADVNDPDFVISTIRKANPSYEYFPNMRDQIDRQMRKAKKNSSDLAAYRAYILNKGTPEVDDIEVLVSVDNWAAVIQQEPPARSGPVAIGIDLGDGTSLSAVVFYWPDTGRMEAYCGVGADPGLVERGASDVVGNRYIRMRQGGELFIYPGKSTNNARFLGDMFQKVMEFEKIGIGADFFKKKIVEQALAQAGLAHVKMEWRRVGQGADGTADIGMFQAEVFDGHLRVPAPSIGLTAAIGEAVIKRNPNGNARVEKGRQRGRIDPASAAVIAAGIGRAWRIPVDEGFEISRLFGTASRD